MCVCDIHRTKCHLCLPLKANTSFPADWIIVIQLLWMCDVLLCKMTWLIYWSEFLWHSIKIHHGEAGCLRASMWMPEHLGASHFSLSHFASWTHPILDSFSVYYREMHAIILCLSEMNEFVLKFPYFVLVALRMKRWTSVAEFSYLACFYSDLSQFFLNYFCNCIIVPS